MKSKKTIVTEEFDENGKVISRTTETVEESDDGYIYPQYRPLFSPYPTWVVPTVQPEWICRPLTTTASPLTAGTYIHGVSSDHTVLKGCTFRNPEV